MLQGLKDTSTGAIVFNRNNTIPAKVCFNPCNIEQNVIDENILRIVERIDSKQNIWKFLCFR